MHVEKAVNWQKWSEIKRELVKVLLAEYESFMGIKPQGKLRFPGRRFVRKICLIHFYTYKKL